MQEVSGTSLSLCPVVIFDITGVDALNFAIVVLVSSY
jgi:hypothetical protein